MKALTLNTHSWLEENMLERLTYFADWIASHDYDVICLQEINQLMDTAEVTNLPTYLPLASAPAIHQDNYAYLLVEALAQRGLTYYWSWSYNHIGYDRYHEGVALLSKTPFQASEVLVSAVDEETDYHTRRVLLADLLENSRAVTVASLHLSWFGKGFEGEWALLEKALLQQKQPLLLMGDFNNPTNQSGYQEIIASPLTLTDSHQVSETVRGVHTILADIDGWDGNQEALKVDHAFLTQEWSVRSSQVIFDGEKGQVLSDHYGLEICAQLS